MIRNSKKYLENQTINQSPHVGSMVEQLVINRREYHAALARELNRHINSVKRYYKCASLQTAILWELSVALKHNFFSDVAAKLPLEFTGANKDTAATHAAELANLQQALDAMTKERDIYKDMMKKG